MECEWRKMRNKELYYNDGTKDRFLLTPGPNNVERLTKRIRFFVYFDKN